MTDKEMRTLRLRAERAGYNSIPDYCNTLVQALVRIADSESGYWGRLAYAALNGRDDLKVPEDLE